MGVALMVKSTTSYPIKHKQDRMVIIIHVTHAIYMHVHACVCHAGIPT